MPRSEDQRLARSLADATSASYQQCFALTAALRPLLRERPPEELLDHLRQILLPAADDEGDLRRRTRLAAADGLLRARRAREAQLNERGDAPPPHAQAHSLVRYDASPALAGSLVETSEVEALIASGGRGLVGEERAILHFLRRLADTLQAMHQQMLRLRGDLPATGDLQTSSGDPLALDDEDARSLLGMDEVEAFIASGGRDLVGDEGALLQFLQQVADTLRALQEQMLRLHREIIAAHASDARSGEPAASEAELSTSSASPPGCESSPQTPHSTQPE